MLTKIKFLFLIVPMFSLVACSSNSFNELKTGSYAYLKGEKDERFSFSSTSYFVVTSFEKNAINEKNLKPGEWLLNNSSKDFILKWFNCTFTTTPAFKTIGYADKEPVMTSIDETLGLTFYISSKVENSKDVVSFTYKNIKVDKFITNTFVYDK
ncbi:MAG: hypothetical protein RR342_04345 [Bacilli bacterium]